jgi:hypothetical protein
LGRKPFVVLFAGELVAEKGIFDLLEASESSSSARRFA